MLYSYFGGERSRFQKCSLVQQRSYTSTTAARFTMRPSRSTTSPSGGPRSRFSAAQPGVDASAAARRSSASQAATDAAVVDASATTASGAPASDPSRVAQAMAVSAAAAPARRNEVGSVALSAAIAASTPAADGMGPSVGITQAAAQAQARPRGHHSRDSDAATPAAARGDGEVRWCHLQKGRERRGDENEAGAWYLSEARAVDERQPSQGEGRRTGAVEQAGRKRHSTYHAGDVARQRQRDRQHRRDELEAECVYEWTGVKCERSPAYRREAPVRDGAELRGHEGLVRDPSEQHSREAQVPGPDRAAGEPRQADGDLSNEHDECQSAP